MPDLSPETHISPPQILESEQSTNLVEKFNDLFYALGKVTAESVDYREPGGKKPLERPIWERALRAKILHNLRTETLHNSSEENIREARTNAIEKGHELDLAVSELLTQGTVSVTSELGKQSSRYAVINPVRSKKIQESTEEEEQPPIVIVPGFSNDIECVGPLAVELAMRGRKVVVVGYPTSSLGSVSSKFADSAATEGYTPFSDYFGKAIQSITEQLGAGTFELWGWSTGCPIISRVSEKLGVSLSRLVLLNPVSSVEQSMKSFAAGIADERYNIGKLASYPFVFGPPKGVSQIPETEEAKARAVGALASAALQKDDYLVSRAKVKDGGEIVVVSATGDMLTKSKQRFPDPYSLANENNYAHLISVPGTHISTIVEPGRILDALGISSV
jgi:thioesterase domain-containing protein